MPYPPVGCTGGLHGSGGDGRGGKREVRVPVARGRVCVVIDRDTVQKKKPHFARFFCCTVHNFKMAKGVSAVGKRLPRPRRAGGKTPPISPWASYRATSTNSESPHWRRGIILLQDPLAIFGMPLQIVRTVKGLGRVDSRPATFLPPDHYGCATIRQPPMGEKDDYDSENSWISGGLPSSSRRRRRGVGSF